MKVGCDIDGVLTPISVRINFKLPWWIFLFLAFVPPNKRMLKLLISLSANHEIILVSSRPRQLDWLTQWWLKRHHAPYSLLCLVGLKSTEQMKLEIIIRENIEIFFDDDEKTIFFLRERGINALSPKGVYLEILTPFSFF